MAELGVIRYVKGENVIAMMTSLVIDLSIEVPSWEDDEVDMEPLVIDLVEDFLMMRVAECIVTPVVIELPPFEEEFATEITLEFEIKAVPWSYGATKFDAITRLGRCYGPVGAVEKKAVTKEEAKEFLVMIKTSEFNIVNQLRKMLTQISLLDFFKSLEKHKNVLLKVLNDVHMPETINHT